MNVYKYEIGISKWDNDTPALIIDLPTMESNLQKMADYFSGVKANLRPHAKTYKATPVLAHMQLQAGAIGITCAKLSEAEVLAASGIRDILIANQIVGPRKIQRLVNLATHTDVKVAVDSLENVEALSKAVQQKGILLRVLVEVNIGHNRCGVAPFEPTLQLSQAVIEAPGLKFMGLMGYDGHCTLRVNETEREKLSREANILLVENRRFLENEGIEVPIVSASGTFTYKIASEIDGITEIQAGTYLLMDTAFIDSGVRDFNCALTVLTTVISKPSYPGAGHLAIVDVGWKGVSTHLGLPEIKSPTGARIISLSQEHGRVDLGDETINSQIGDKAELWVRDANGTINLYDKFYAVRNDVVEAVWEIPLCGKRT